MVILYYICVPKSVNFKSCTVKSPLKNIYIWLAVDKLIQITEKYRSLLTIYKHNIIDRNIIIEIELNFNEYQRYVPGFTQVARYEILLFIIFEITQHCIYIRL